MTTERRSKRHPVEDNETGPEAAVKYLTRHRPSAGRASSLKKLDRATRIHNGTAPLRYGVPTRRERIVLERAEKRQQKQEALDRIALKRQIKNGMWP